MRNIIVGQALCLLFLLSSLIGKVEANRTKEDVTRNIALAAIVIGGVAFLMTCFLCCGGMGMGMFNMFNRRSGGGNTA
jgi:hypothetical protein